MLEIDEKEYVIQTCSITDCECSGGCDNCETALSQQEEEVKDEMSAYTIDLVSISGYPSFISNRKNTVGRAELSDLNNVKKFLRMPWELIEKKYISNVFMEEHYPEWVKTTKILGITEQPEKMIYAVNHPMILIFSDCLYMVAPKCKN